MNVNLELYRIFYVVAKNKHMTKASKELCISQPAISQSIKKLEDQLGGILFIRSNKGMELTEEGKMFYEYVKGSLELIKTAENNFTHFKDLSQGEIKVGISTSLTKVILLDSLKKFHEDYPNIKINIKNELTKNLLSDLQNGKLDFVIFNESNIKESNVKLNELKKLKQSFIYNNKYYNFSNKIYSLNELNSLPLILQNKESNSRQYLDSFMAQNNVFLKPYLEVVSQELLIEFTNVGLGVGFSITDLALRNNSELRELMVDKNIPDVTVYIATNKSSNLPFASSKFLEYIKNI